jgi:hypothetical protein
VLEHEKLQLLLAQRQRLHGHRGLVLRRAAPYLAGQVPGEPV